MSKRFSSRRRFGAPRRNFQSRPPQRRSSISPHHYINTPLAQLPALPSYQPTHTFSDFTLHPTLLANLRAKNYTTPTPIQDQAIPYLLAGKDVVGLANTGTGKTAAFLLPFMNKLLSHPTQSVLILAPTRELAQQIFQEFKSFATSLSLKATLCVGGASLNSQISQLHHQPHFVIGTPGRIKDLVNRGNLNPHRFSNIVLDEVDRMLDIGFRPDILYLITKLPTPKHSAFFSATINKEASEIINRLMTNPVTVSVTHTATPAQIHQNIIPVKTGQNKIDLLHNLLKKPEFSKVIVFGRTKHGINKLHKHLLLRGLRVSAIHGNKSQGARIRALEQFKQGQVQALLATDVASRGIDIDNITHVINFDEPGTYDDYVHRIGRTGRAGKQGIALTFVNQ